MEHEEYKEWVDVDKEIAYLVEHANCTREEAAALVEGEMRYVESSRYEDDLEMFVDEPHGLNLTQFVEAAVWSFEIEAAMACTYDGKPAFSDCFVNGFIQEQPDIDLAYEKVAELMNAQFPLLWDEEAEKSAIRSEFAKLHEGECTHFGRDILEDGDPYRNLWWEVLAREDNRVLLVNSYVIDARPYDINPDPRDESFGEDFFEDENYDDDVFQAWCDKLNEFKPTTWEFSDLRTWLNGEFLEKAFNDWERSAIAPTTVHTEGEDDTCDRVFCLSVEEVNQYFGGTCCPSRCKPTARAEAKGVEWTEDDDLAHEPEVVLAGHTKSASWWLRGHRLTYCHGDHSRAVFVNAVGGPNLMGVPIDSKHIGVRPAMWVYAQEEE